MKILCLYSHCGPAYVRTGWGRVFSAMGHEFVFWKPWLKSAFDAFAEFEPDIFLGTTYDLDSAIFKCLIQRPQVKVAFFGSAWGDLVEKVDKNLYPITRVTEQEKRLVGQLKYSIGKPDFVFVHVTDKYLEGTMGGWKEIGVEPLGILNAADTFEYFPCAPDPLLKTDIGFIGGYWEYKARNLDKYMLPLCQPNSQFNVKIFGNQPWPVPQYLGEIEDRLARVLFNSATICPNISEPHSTDLGWDTVERPFKVLASGGFCISDQVAEAREIFTEDELIMAPSPREFKNSINGFLAHPEERKPFMEAGRKKVLASHTYFDRVFKILNGLGLEEEAERCLIVKRKYIDGKIKSLDSNQ